MTSQQTVKIVLLITMCLAANGHAQDDYTSAESLLEQALAMKKRLLGEEHPDVARSLNDLANLYELQGRYEKAEPLYLEALMMRQKLLRENHPDVATTLSNLANLYASQGRHEIAEPLFFQALEIFKLGFPPDHSRIKSVELSLQRIRSESNSQANQLSPDK